MKIGITGHQTLGGEENKHWVRQQLEELVDSLDVQLAYSSLAIGADQLFAKVLVSRKIPFIAVIPCENYEETFSEGALIEYYTILRQAQSQIILNYENPCEDAFFAAGKEIVNLSDLMIAVWNGKPAEGLGGTGDIVQLAQNQKVKVIHINNIEKTRVLL